MNLTINGYVVETEDGLIVGPFIDANEASVYIEDGALGGKIRAVLGTNLMYERDQKVTIIGTDIPDETEPVEVEEEEFDEEPDECCCENCCDYDQKQDVKVADKK